MPGGFRGTDGVLRRLVLQHRVGNAYAVPCYILLPAVRGCPRALPSGGVVPRGFRVCHPVRGVLLLRRWDLDALPRWVLLSNKFGSTHAVCCGHRLSSRRGCAVAVSAGVLLPRRIFIGRALHVCARPVLPRIKHCERRVLSLLKLLHGGHIGAGAVHVRTGPLLRRLRVVQRR